MSGYRHYSSFLARCLTPFWDARARNHLRETIRADRVEWGAVVKIASQQMVITSVWSALRAKGLDDLLPEDLRVYLCEVHRLNAARNRAIGEQLEELLSQWNAVGVEPILIKGSAFLFTGVLKDPGDRMMMDLDVLASGEDAQRMTEASLSRGYEYLHENSPLAGRQHLTPLVRNDRPVSVEIHVRLAKEWQPQWVTPEEAYRRSSTRMMNGLHFRVLAPCHGAFLTMFHSEALHAGYRRHTLSLRSLWDFALLTDHYGEHLNWGEFTTICHNHGLEGLARAYLHAGNRLLGTPIPASLEPSLRDRAHYYQCLPKGVLTYHIPLRGTSAALYKALCNMRNALDEDWIYFKCGYTPGFWKLLGLRLRRCRHLLGTYVFGHKRSLLRSRLFPSGDDEYR